MILLALPPLTAAQIMLLLDRFLGANFFDTQAGGSAVLWQQLLLDLRTPGGLHPNHPRLRLHLGDRAGLFAQADLRLPDHGRSDSHDRRHQRERLGASHVLGRHDFGGQHLLCHLDVSRGDPDRDQDLQLAGDDVWRQDSPGESDGLLPRLPVPVPDRRLDRHHAGGRTVQLATDGLLLCRGHFTTRWSAASCSPCSPESITGIQRRLEED